MCAVGLMETVRALLIVKIKNEGRTHITCKQRLSRLHHLRFPAQIRTVKLLCPSHPFFATVAMATTMIRPGDGRLGAVCHRETVT